MGIIYNRPDPTIPSWSETGEAIKPSNEDIREGWPDTQIPPARQEFNWIDKRQDEAFKYLCQVSISDWHIDEQYQGRGLAIGSNGSVYWNLQVCTGIDPVFDNTGCWELTTIRLSDADARYIAKGSAMFLTQEIADGRYQLRADMNNFVTLAVGDNRYALLSNLGAFLTLAAGDARYALKTDLSGGFLTNAVAAQTYLRIVDAANTYLTHSAAAQYYLSIGEANNRFAQANSYAEVVANNAAGAIRSLLPNIYSQTKTNAAGTMVGNWIVMTTNNFHVCWGHGVCQETDQLTPPDGFPQAVMTYRGWVRTIPAILPSLPAIGAFDFQVDGNGVVALCYYIKQNDGNAHRGRGYCTGAWFGMGLF